MSGLLLAMLDQSVVGTALPAIVGALDGGGLYAWAITAYLVTATVSIPVYARLSDRHGRRALLLVGMALFVLGSALCASAGSMGQLVAWRALQGFGAGALESLSFILVADLYAGRRSAALQGALAGLMGVAFLLGPLVGGALTDHVGWRWVFLVNVPVGLLALAAVATALPAAVGRSEDRRRPLDVAGIALLTGAVALALVGLSERATAGPGEDAWAAWAQPGTGGLLLAGLALAAAFVAVERRAAAPVLPPALFADRRTAAMLIAGATSTFGLFAGVLLLPRYLQDAEGASATHSGVLVYPLLLGLLVAVNVGPVAMLRARSLRGPLLVACAVAGVGGAGFATFGAGTPRWQLLACMALLGAGIGPTLSGLQIGLRMALPPEQVGGAIGALLLLRQIGGSVAIAAAATVLGARADAGPAAATGDALAVVALAGTAVAAVALVALRPGAVPMPARPSAEAAAASSAP
nr:MFS transporter [Patulibacter sp. SYSU D01012]